MKTFFGIVLVVVVLIVGAWVAIFGGVGALLSKGRGGSTMQGFWWGALLGPIGWIVVAWRTRPSRRAPITFEEWSGTDLGSIAGSADLLSSEDLGHDI
jgi:hypothetical protein